MIRIPRALPWHGLFRTLAGTRAGAALASRILHPLDGIVIRLTHGRWALAGVLGGLPIVTLTTVGRRSGRPRSVPLIGIPNGSGVVLVASNWARREHPAWYLNLMALPEAMVAAGGREAIYLARETQGAERERCWRLAVALYPGYAVYQRRVPGREIPVLALTPAEEGQDGAAGAA